MYPAKGYWQKSDLPAQIKVTAKNKPYNVQSANIKFTPLIENISITPADVLSNGFCPYTDEAKTFSPSIEYELWNTITKIDFVPSSPIPITTIETIKRSYTIAYGLEIKCAFPQDLSKNADGGVDESSITFTASGGDLKGEIKYEIADFANFAAAGAGKIFEWEGFLNQYNLPRTGDSTILLSSNGGEGEPVILPGVDNVDKINAVRDLGRESTTCPLDIVKEYDNYKIKISLKHPEHPEQKQTFELHNLKVQYKFGD